MDKTQSGIAAVFIAISVFVILMLAGAFWYVYSSQGKDQSMSQVTDSTNTVVNSSESKLMWQQTGDGWQPTGSIAPCKDQPMLELPVDINKVSSVLYPGQNRGGQYKPHGGFRFDSQSGQISVKAPIDGFVIRGSHYIEQGEVQYSFDIFNNCGVMYRLDHLATISQDLSALTLEWPAPQENDSRTNIINNPLYIKQGDQIATSVGFSNSNNIFVDWGVYDFRQNNKASEQAAYQSSRIQDKELSWHAVCWLSDWVSNKNSSVLLSLPAGDSISGKYSDYC